MTWRAALSIAMLLLAGCAGLPPPQPRTPTYAPAPDAGVALARFAAAAALPAGQSGFWPITQPDHALAARLALIEAAERTVDLQTFLVGDDAVGHAMLRALRDAARRGVRVRLFVDDWYTRAVEPLLLGLAAERGVEVRVYNPFGGWRGSAFGRLAALAGDFRRLNHRMHNKLLVADGAVAIVGGRNLADEYFQQAQAANFIDLELLAAGALTPQLESLFDLYWNSDEAVAIAALSAPVGATAARAAFDRDTLPQRPFVAPIAPDSYGAPPLEQALAAQRPRLVAATAGARADWPDKARAGAASQAFDQTLAGEFIRRLSTARSDILIVTPYLIPGRNGIERLRAARREGIAVSVITNALATTDEPLAGIGYRRYRRELLELGVRLYEVSSPRLLRQPEFQRAFGGSRGRLHAKATAIDREWLLIGSMNLDPRSAYVNTEIGVAIRSPALTRMLVERLGDSNTLGAYEVQLDPDDGRLRWIGHDDDGDEVLQDDPDLHWWQRWKTWLEWLFVNEGLL